jgi:hypothetical protein
MKANRYVVVRPEANKDFDSIDILKIASLWMGALHVSTKYEIRTAIHYLGADTLGPLSCCSYGALGVT